MQSLATGRHWHRGSVIPRFQNGRKHGTIRMQQHFPKSHHALGYGPAGTEVSSQRETQGHFREIVSCKNWPEHQPLISLRMFVHDPKKIPDQRETSDILSNVLFVIDPLAMPD